MGRTQQIDTEWFVSEYVQGGGQEKGLDIIEAWVYLVLSCNSLSNCSGAYQIPMKILTVITKLERNALEVILGRFEQEGRILYKNGWVVIANPTELNKQNNASMEESAQKMLKTAPDFVNEFINKYRKPTKIGKKEGEGGTPCPHGGTTVVPRSSNVVKSNVVKPQCNVINEFEEVKLVFQDEYAKAMRKQGKKATFLHINDFDEKDLKALYDKLPDKTELTRAWALYCQKLAGEWNENINLKRFLRDYSDVQQRLA
jgi:hypothetical protein